MVLYIRVAAGSRIVAVLLVVIPQAEGQFGSYKDVEQFSGVFNANSEKNVRNSNVLESFW